MTNEITNEDLARLRLYAVAAADKSQLPEVQGMRLTNFRWQADPDTILTLIAKVESLAADAERYRWLRDKANSPIDEAIDRFDPMVFRCHPKHPLSWDGVSVGAELDEVVDTAMAKEKAQ